jgi:hypothetical protein
MARPPLGPLAMDYTVKFRLTKQEHSMLQKIARGGALSSALRQMIHDEYHRMGKKGT